VAICTAPSGRGDSDPFLRHVADRNQSAVGLVLVAAASCRREGCQRATRRPATHMCPTPPSTQMAGTHILPGCAVAWRKYPSPLTSRHAPFVPCICRSMRLRHLNTRGSIVLLRQDAAATIFMGVTRVGRARCRLLCFLLLSEEADQKLARPQLGRRDQRAVPMSLHAPHRELAVLGQLGLKQVPGREAVVGGGFQ
jgi:hypothetical protein